MHPRPLQATPKAPVGLTRPTWELAQLVSLLQCTQDSLSVCAGGVEGEEQGEWRGRSRGSGGGGVGGVEGEEQKSTR